MLLDLTPDQEFFRDTTAKFLADQVPADLLQRMAGTVPADWEVGYCAAESAGSGAGRCTACARRGNGATYRCGNCP